SKSGGMFLAGLIDINELRQTTNYDEKKSGLEANKSGVGRPAVGPLSGGGRGDETRENASAEAASGESRLKTSLNALLRAERKRSVVRSRESSGGNGRDHHRLPYRPDVLKRPRIHRRRPTCRAGRGASGSRGRSPAPPA